MIWQPQVKIYEPEYISLPVTTRRPPSESNSTSVIFISHYQPTMASNNSTFRTTPALSKQPNPLLRPTPNS
ncbi:hypothetical protein BDV28DRAFT_29811 [Aspergillus coremiiformis]|uniref:Uncharacterized protein n=1 Tax=Aspergillus coremiiformis TaxID=138285 RepID=A0A5N6YZN0_9EURO|nr:hypothetical protein BDV28DRAFT_29811 [Aspergillus coremiiformis]